MIEHWSGVILRKFDTKMLNHYLLYHSNVKSGLMTSCCGYKYYISMVMLKSLATAFSSNELKMCLK